jgi:two-component system sensor histidine kinase RegB
MPHLRSSDDRAEIILRWLIHLRWAAVVGQLVVVATASALLESPVPTVKLLGLVAALALSNLLLILGQGRVASPSLCGAALTFDILQLAGLLHATGGAHNPFSVLFLVHITLAAVVLGAPWTWFLGALSVACYGLLFISHRPLEYLDHRTPEMSLHLQGMWIAFTLAAALTSYLVVRLSRTIDERDRTMAAMRERVARNERVASVATLAAGAAHELGTPLGTIAVAAKELAHRLGEIPEAHRDSLIEDVALIRSEVDRCRAILNRLATESGQPPGEAPVELPLELLAEAIASALPPRDRGRLRLRVTGDAAVTLPRAALLQIAQNLLSNAFEAGESVVTLEIGEGSQGFRMVVSDEGRGMSAEVLARLGEPFFSTKRPGEGLGLGVFIARSLSEQMGGRFSIQSAPGRGTRAEVEIPGLSRPKEGALS